MTVSYPVRCGYERKPVTGIELTLRAVPSTVRIPDFLSMVYASMSQYGSSSTERLLGWNAWGGMP